MSTQAPTLDEIRAVTRKTIAVLTANQFTCCLFGSVGCLLYGNSRTPNDIDVIVMTTTYTTEHLKALLGRTPGFYLRPSGKPGETYKILYYRLQPNFLYSRRSCKVDILIPGIMNIPLLPSERIVWKETLPVLPLLVLLLLKLQGWSDHRASTRSDMQQKQYVDIRDINQLVVVAARSGEHLSRVPWLPDAFLAQGYEHLALYLRIVRPAVTSYWREIGFDIVELSL